LDKETRVHIDVARTEKREQLPGEKEPKENAGIEKGKVEDKFSKMSNEIAKLCQKLTDKKIAEIDAMLEKKEKEIMSV